MWILILIISIIGGFYAYSKDKSKLKDRIVDQGGMAIKYKKLVSHFLVDSNARITKLTHNTVEVTWQNGPIWIKHTINQGFSELMSVEWETNIPLAINHKLYWQFPENMPQELMIEKITQDINFNLRHLISNLPK